MLENYSTNATVAKIRSINGSMITSDQLLDLAGKKNVSDVAQILKTNRIYRDELEGIDITKIHRGYLEQLIEKSCFQLYVKLCKFQQLNRIPFYNYNISKHEIEQIMSMINDINSNVTGTFINTLPKFVEDNSSIPFIELAKCETFDELVDVLKHTPYAGILKSVPLKPNGMIAARQSEQRLYTYYFNTLLKSINKDFSSQDAKTLSDYLKKDIDLTNMTNAYRLKTYYKYSSDHIKVRMLPFTKIGSPAMNAIYEASTSEDMLELIGKTPYFSLKKPPDPNMIEHSIDNIKHLLSKRLIATSQSAPVVMYAFLNICLFEVENLTNIIEGIRYQMPQTEIQKLLII
ncbi:MAG: V-type ATPase subunit [Clostridiales bacterium]|nr:V-type ATPase subunit [Clostridiales bacterium]